MKSISTIAIALLLNTVTFSSLGQILITLNDAILKAKENNQGLKVASLEVEFEKELSKSISQIPNTSFSLMMGQYNSIQHDNNLSITQDFPFPTVFRSEKNLAISRLKSSEWIKASTQNELIFQVRQTYLQLQFLHAKHRLIQRQDSIYSELVHIASILYNAGQGTLLQKTSAEAKYYELQIFGQKIKSNIEVYEYQLQILLNLPEPVLIADSSLRPLELTIQLDGEQTDQNPIIRHQFSLADVALQERKVMINKLLPEFNIGFFSQTMIGNQTMVSGVERYFDSKYRFNGFQVGISIPLWLYPHQAKIKSASIAVEKNKLKAQHFQNKLKGQWHKEVQNYINLKNNLEYYSKSALPNAQLILHQSKLAYKKGEISQAELWQNLQQIVGIEDGHLQALLEINQSIITIEFLSGIYSKSQ